MSLFDQVPLTFTRYSQSTVDDYGSIVKGTTSTVETTGALQPYRAGDTTVLVPEGSNPRDIKIYYTKTLLKNADTIADTYADTCIISGRTYEVFDSGDWATNTSTLAHYKVVLVRKEA